MLNLLKSIEAFCIDRNLRLFSVNHCHQLLIRFINLAKIIVDGCAINAGCSTLNKSSQVIGLSLSCSRSIKYPFNPR